MALTSPLMLPGNLLPAADSDFETFTGNWTGTTNCSVAQSAAQSFTGSHSMAVTATANGATLTAYTRLPVNPSTGVVFSVWVYNSNAARTAFLNIGWWTLPAGGSFISTSANSTTVTLQAGAWTPIPLAVASPATAGGMVLNINTGGMLASEVTYVDMVYSAPSLVQTLIAWQTPPLSTSPLFADMTPFTRADQAISLTRGRPDETATVQAGTATLTLDNQVIAGAFSQGNSNSPFAVQLSRRMRVSFADEAGAWHTRFDGTITDIEPAWLGGPGLEGTVAVTANGLIGWLARNPGPTLSVLKTLIEEEMLVDGPTDGLWSLGDRATATAAADESGNSAAPLQQHHYPKSGLAGTLAFGAAGGIIGALAPGFTTSVLPAASFTPNATSGGNVQLEASLASPVSASTGFSAEICYSVVGSIGANSITPFSLTNSRTGASIGFAYATAASGSYLFYQPNPAGTLTTSAGVTLPAIANAVITVSGTTMTLYINGSSVQTLTIPAAFTADYVTVGGPFRGPFGTIAMSGFPIGWFGQLNCFAVYPSVLSAGRITAHYTAAMLQNGGQLINTLITNTLAYSGIPSAFYNVPSSGGVSYADPYDATGQNPLAMIQLYQQTDWGVFYEAANGQLTWQDRAARYGNEVTPALVLAGGQYEPSFTFPLTTQYLINDATFANNNIPNGIRAVNAASLTANGTYANGTSAGSQFTNAQAPSSLTTTTAGSPLTGPWYSYPYQPSTTPVSDVLNDAANWQVNIYGTPVPRSPSLEIDLSSALGSGTQVSRAAVFACDVGSVIQLTGLPSTSPAGTRVAYQMVEGVDETFTRNDTALTWTLTFNTSPASQSAAWIAGDANLGVLDSTAVVGLGTDGANQAGTEYVGQPYVVPTFAAGMNRTGSVGANDMRGLTANTSLQVFAPCATVQQVSLAQSIPNSSNTAAQFDTVWYDNTPNGGGWRIPSNATTYTVQLPGVYLLAGSVVFAANATGVRQAWFEHNGTVVGVAAEALASAAACAVPVTQQVLCAQGDTLQLWCSQSSGGALGLTTANGGCTFSILWLGT